MNKEFVENFTGKSLSFSDDKNIACTGFKSTVFLQSGSVCGENNGLWKNEGKFFKIQKAPKRGFLKKKYTIYIWLGLGFLSDVFRI